MTAAPPRACLLALLAGAAIAPQIHGAAPTVLGSPDGRMTLTIGAGLDGTFTWRVTLGGKPVIDPSPIGIMVDGINLGANAEVARVERYRIDERYDWRGVHSVAVNRSNGARLTLRRIASHQTYTIDARVSNDAVAFRFVVPGTGRRVPDAATGFRVPTGTIVWSHGLRNHYESQYDRRAIEDIPAGDWAGPPVTFKLPADAG